MVGKMSDEGTQRTRVHSDAGYAATQGMQRRGVCSDAGVTVGCAGSSPHRCLLRRRSCTQKAAATSNLFNAEVTEETEEDNSLLPFLCYLCYLRV